MQLTKTKPSRTTTTLVSLALLCSLSSNVQSGDVHSRIRYADVIRVEPIIEQVKYKESYEQCWSEHVQYDYDDNRHDGSSWRVEHRPEKNRQRDSVNGVVIGGLVGGAIGHAVGAKKPNKKVGVAIGSILGATIGYNIANDDKQTAHYRERHHRHHRHYRERDRWRRGPRRCETRYRDRYRDERRGYNVWYRYNGAEFRTRMGYDPGRRIRVRVEVSPIKD